MRGESEGRCFPRPGAGKKREGREGLLILKAALELVLRKGSVALARGAISSSPTSLYHTLGFLRG